MLKEDIFNSCKQQLKIHIETLQELGVWNTEIEIELYFYIKDMLKGE